MERLFGKFALFRVLDRSAELAFPWMVHDLTSPG